MKRVKVVAPPDEKAEHRKKFGGFNDYPPNWKPCGADEFWNKFFMYGVGMTESRQMNKPKGVHLAMHLRGAPIAQLIDAKLFIYEDGTGLAMVPTRDLDSRSNITPRLYKFAVCEHQWIEQRGKAKRQFGVSHRFFECAKCHDKKRLESSD